MFGKENEISKLIERPRSLKAYFTHVTITLSESLPDFFLQAVKGVYVNLKILEFLF